MSVLSAQSIRRRAIFTPHSERTACPRTGLTYGLGPAGYDVRIAEDVVLRPGDFALASTMEHFCMPNDVLGRVCNKSTLARMGLSVDNTVIEPGWSGYLTLELSNRHPQTDAPGAWEDAYTLRLVAGQPIAQVLLEPLDEPTEMPYRGRYQHQERGAQPARFLVAVDPAGPGDRTSYAVGRLVEDEDGQLRMTVVETGDL